jgi:hypothetical protein
VLACFCAGNVAWTVSGQSYPGRVNTSTSVPLSVSQAATAWLDHFRLCRLIGMSDLEARVGAVEAWDSVAGPALAKIEAEEERRRRARAD